MRRSPTSLIPGLLRLAACLLLALPAAGFAADDSAAPAPALTAKQQAAADKAAAKAAAERDKAAAQAVKDADKAAKREAKLLQLFIAQPYLELHTGPGRGYPVTQVVGRGEAIDVLLKKTEWFKVRTERGIEGWANEKDLVLAHEADGTLFVFSRGNRESFTHHTWETGIFAGAYAGASTISAYESYSFNDQLKIEITLGQYLGNISNGYIAEIGLNHVFMPQWRLSPFITLGTGYDRVVPKVTLAQPLDSTDQTAYIGAGARFYMTRRFFLRADYRYHTVFTSRDQNEVKNEWKAGFAFFY